MNDENTAENVEMGDKSQNVSQKREVNLKRSVLNEQMQLIMYVLYSVSILHIYGRLLFLYGLFTFVLHSCVDLTYIFIYI